MNRYTVGKNMDTWKSGEAQTLTFIVTEDCNLRCKYCYITHKSSNKKMSFETAKSFIDMLFTKNIETQSAVIIEFIGGEPLIEIDLIDQITDYFKTKSFEENHDWFWNYRISICTNGMNYSNEGVQKYIRKNHAKISLGISIDGTKVKHDLQRVTKDGKGSYDKIMEIVPLWLSQFKGATKVTFASQDLIYLKDSIISLWNKGITDVASNVVFEDVWLEKDDKILEDQLVQLADYVLEKKIFNEYYCTFFDDKIGCFYDKEDKDRTYCGAGKMLAVGPNGNLYPCIRYKDYSLNKQKEWIIGTVEKGINMDKVRPFILSSTRYQSDNECLSCPIASGCAFCQGFNYDESEIGTNFHRAKYICKMHKARARANDYYFSKLFNMFGVKKDEHPGHEKRKIFILLGDDYVTYCQNENKNEKHTFHSTNSIIKDSLNFTRENFGEPILVHSKSVIPTYLDIYKNYNILHYIPIHMHDRIDQESFRDCRFVIEDNDIKSSSSLFKNINQNLKLIFNIRMENLKKFYEFLMSLFKISDDIEVNILNITTSFNFELYKRELTKIKNELLRLKEEENMIKRINIITDLSNNTIRSGCKAGEKSFVISPKGDVYPCCAMFSDDIEKIGTIYLKELTLEQYIYKLNKAPLCVDCISKQCSRCNYLNKNQINEINIPPSFQCRKGIIEYKIAIEYKNGAHIDIENTSKDIDYEDPIGQWIKDNNVLNGYYKY